MRDPLHRVSVRTKLAALFAVLFLLAFGGGGYFVSQSARSALESQILQRIDIQCRASAHALDGELRLLARRAEDFASDGFLREHFAEWSRESSASAREEQQRLLLRHLADNKLPLVPAFERLTLVTRDGALGADTGGEVDPRLAEVVEGARDVPGVWHSPLLVAPGRPPLLALATPLRSLDGAAELGRLVAWVQPDRWVADALAGIEPAPSTGAGRGETIVRLEDPRGGRVLVSPAPSEGAPPILRFDLAAADLHAEPLPVGFFLRRFPVRQNGWVVEVRVHALDAFSPVSGLQSRFLVVAIVLAAIAALLLLFPMRFLVTPLGVLSDAARRLREGDHAARVPVESSDEVGDLADAFNHMAEAVQDRTRRLEASARALRAGQCELREERDRLHTVLRSLRDGLVVVDADGRPVLWNAAGERLAALATHGDPRVAAHYRCGRDGALAADCAACLVEPGGPALACVLDVEGRVLEVHAAPLPPDATGRRGRVLVARDITERLAADERQIHQERLSVLGEVAAVVAHELNNPLASVKMFAQMVHTGLPQDSPYREHAEVILRNADACRLTIRDLLGFAASPSPEPGAVTIHDVLADVARFIRPLAERAQAVVDVESAAAVDLVDGDELQLRQLFVNLVMNAVQAGARRVVLQTSIHGHAFRVDVVDDGAGVPPDVRARIFDAFFTTKPRGDGTGLGLSTARRIAELHGGGLNLVESAPGRTVFRVRLRMHGAAVRAAAAP